MRILIDLQGAQTTGSRHRGIGRYSLSLAEGIIRERGEHDVHVLLNGAFPESIPDIRKRLEGLLQDSSFHVFHPVGETRQFTKNNSARRQASEIIREAVITSLKPDLVHVTSHFEGFGDEAITSIKRLGNGPIQSVTLYDLIPLIHQQLYLENPNIRRWYDERLLQLRRADLLLAISASSALEAVEHLGFPDDDVVNVSTAADPHFEKRRIPRDRAAELRSKYGLSARFVMYTGGIDYRKNIERLIGGFAQMKSNRDGVALAIVCSCNDFDRNRLRGLCEELGLSEADVILTGFVPEEDLVDLYNLCELFVFPSWHEGFGLPALEAMHCGAPVIGSDRSSLPEVIGLKDALFDPFDETAIASKMERALTDKTFRSRLLANSKKQSNTFSWKLTAQRAVAAFEQAWQRRQQITGRHFGVRRPRLAYVSPIRPAKSGIADYSAELLPELSRHYDIDLIVPSPTQAESADEKLKNEFPIHDAESFLADRKSYDRVLYHFGNSDHHAHMVELIRRVPGVVVQHDFYLSGLMAWMEHARGLGRTFTEALFESHGIRPLIDLNNGIPLEQVMWEYPANAQVIERALGVIVHSTFSKQLAERWLGPRAADDWTVIPHLRVRADELNRTAARSAVDAADEILICSFGGLGETKQSDLLIEAFMNTNACRSGRAKLVLVGAMPQDKFGERLAERLTELGSPSNIQIIGRASRETYEAYLQSADIAVQLRTLSRGETSGAVLDCLNFGIPTIVNANGSMADLPPDAVDMLPDKFSRVELSRAIDRLVNNEIARERLSTQGRALIRGRHDPRRCADEYQYAIERAYDDAAASPLVVADIIGSTAGNLDERSRVQASKLLEPLFRTKLARRVYLDIGRIEGTSRSDQLSSLIRAAAEPLLASATPFDVVSLAESGDYVTRRREALRAFGIHQFALEECTGRLSSHDRVKVLAIGEADEKYLSALADLFLDVKVVTTVENSHEAADVFPEFQ